MNSLLENIKHLKQKSGYRPMSIVLALLLMVSAAVSVADLRIPSAFAAGGDTVIASFEEAVTQIAAPVGTEATALALPTSLTANMADGSRRSIPVTWDDGGLYDKNTAGTYSFTADIGTYLYAQPRPIAAVTLSAEADEPPETVYANSISGSLRLDVLTDENSGAAHGDGIRQAEEFPLADFAVSLYRAGGREAPAAAVQTDEAGQYQFENIEPGSYVVGVSRTEKDGTEYLLPTAGITQDNRFEDFDETGTTVFSKVIPIEADTAVTGVDAGMRTPPEVTAYAAIEYANSASELQAAINNVENGGSVLIMKSFNMNQISMHVPVGKSVTIRSAGDGPYTITQLRRSEIGGRHFTVGGSLTLKNITLAGWPTGGGDGVANGGVQVNAGGTLLMEADAAITNCYAGPSGGGVLLKQGSSFTMVGGVISGNRAGSNGGGVYVDRGGRFIMNGGEISGNIAGSNAGGVYAGDSFTMNGGKIFENRANNNGGGVFATGDTDLVLDGGAIFSNTAGNLGGGVYATTGARFTLMSGDIFENTAKTGAGIAFFTGCTFTMEGGRIFGNITNSAYSSGGGIYSHSGLIINSGEISGNRGGYGAGLYLAGDAALTMTGGEITGNIADQDGGGIYTQDYSYENPADPAKYSAVSITGSGRVEDNTAGRTAAPPINQNDFTLRAVNPFPGNLLDNDNINYQNPAREVILSKTVQGDYSNQSKAFLFTVTLKDASGAPLSEQVLSYTGGTLAGTGAAAPENGSITLDQQGTAAVSLRHGQRITLSVPPGYKLAVQENLPSDNLYTASVQTNTGGTVNTIPGGATGELVVNGDTTIAFVNTLEAIVPTGISSGMNTGGLLLGFAVLLLLMIAVSDRLSRRRQR